VHHKMLAGFAAAAIGFACFTCPAAAQPVLPDHEVATIVRSMGLTPLSRPARRGATFVVRAGDDYGQQVTVTIDARVGRVLSVQRVAAAAARSPSGYVPVPGYVPMPPYPPDPYGAPDEFGPGYPPPAGEPQVIYGPGGYSAVARPPAPIPAAKPPLAKPSKSAAAPLPKAPPKETAAAQKDASDDSKITTGTTNAKKEPDASTVPAIPPVQPLE